MDAFDRVRRERPDAALVLVGDGPMRRSIETWAGRATHPQVIMTGFKQVDDLPLYYALERKSHDADLDVVADIEHRCLPAVVWLARSGVNVARDRWQTLTAEAEE